MTTVRRADWSPRLIAFVNATMAEPFRYGHHDALAWALRGVDAMCGTACAAVVAGEYRDYDGWRAYLDVNGWADTLAAGSALLGITTLDAAQTSTMGDVIYLPESVLSSSGDPCVPPGGGLGLHLGAAVYCPASNGEMFRFNVVQLESLGAHALILLAVLG